MSVAKKLAFAISPLVILSVSLTLFGYWNVRHVQMQLPSVSEFAITSSELIYGANILFYRQAGFYEDVMFMYDTEMLREAKEMSDEAGKLLEKLRGMSDISKDTQVMVDDLIQRHRHYTDTAHQIYAQMSEDESFLENADKTNAVRILGKEKNQLENIFSAFSNVIRKEISQKISSVDQSTKQRNNLSAFVSFIIIGSSVIMIFFLIRRGIMKSANKVISGLNESAEQMASASGMILSSGHSLAQRTSEQAAASEEVASTLEEIASMTRQNADHTKQADAMMKELRQATGFANRAMSELSVSIDEVSKAGDKTSEIVKSIEKIAFQTNLLSLNAAVEAARAGESGAGFAVVADEVRSLAVRAANASKNTSELLGDISQKVNGGSALVEKTLEAFAKVSNTSAKTASLTEGILAAYEEQAKSIQQVSDVVVENDQVIQQNASSAERSASASEEMNRQAERVKQFVDKLVLLLRGASRHTDIQKNNSTASSVGGLGS